MRYSIVTFVIITLAALLFTATGTRINVEVSTILWVILSTFIIGAIWMLGFLISIR